MLTETDWKAKEQELERLKAERAAMKVQMAELSRKIHILSVSVRHYHENYDKMPRDYTQTAAYQMFGKRLKDFTAEEYRIYYSTRQRIRRAKKKGGTHNV